MFEQLKKQWFLILLFGVVAAGLCFPAPGLWIGANVSNKVFLFTLLFLSSLPLEAKDLLAGLRAFRPIMLALLGTYAILPLLFCASAKVLEYFHVETALGMGLIVMGAAPTSQASAAIWTRFGGGNTALAVALTLINSAANVVLGPLVLRMALGAGDVEWPIEKLIGDLALVVLLPIIVGQFAGRLLREGVARNATLISVISRFVLLTIILTAASKAAERAGNVSALSVALLVALCVFSHMWVLMALDFLGRLIRIPREDRIATLMVGGQKTLPVGVQLLTYFPGMELGVLSMMCYHASQLLFDSVLVEVFRRRSAKKTQSAASDAPAPADKPAETQTANAAQ